MKHLKILIILLTIIACATISLIGCSKKQTKKEIPHEKRFGIYSLDLNAQNTELIYSSDEKISALHLNNANSEFAFYKKIDGTSDKHEEIFSLNFDGTNLVRLTNNKVQDAYPIWSPDDKEIAWLSFQKTLDIYKMQRDGSDQKLLYDSGGHDADISWQGNKIAFTRNSQIWLMNSDGTNARQITNPPKAGQKNNANLPFGDYDPRLSPDGTKIVFERLENDASKHGNYNIYTINPDGTNETRLTNNGYSQGLANWSPDGKKLAYLVSAINEEGKYDIYAMNADGSDNENITPDYFPANFLCHSPVFSKDNSIIYFVGEWWE